MKKSKSLQKISSSSHSGPLSSAGAARVSKPINPRGFSRPATNTNQGSKYSPQCANLNRQVSQSGPRSGDMAAPSPKSAPSSGNVKTSGPQSSTPSIVRANSSNLLPATGVITSGHLLPSGALKKVTYGPVDPSGMPLKIASMN